jgi:hypothetical protein
MSRIPAPGAIVGTTTVSAVLALCLLGTVGAQAPAAADESTTDTSTIGASLIAAENTATVVGLTTTTSTLSGATTNPAVTNAVATNAALTNAALTNAALTNESAGTAASIETMQTLGLAGGVASEQIPAAAMLSNAAATAHVVAVPASLAKKVAVPKPAAPAITGTPLQIAHTIATQEGLSQQQWVCVDSLWQQESKFQTNARNRRSGAFGIPQALPASRMASAGADWRTNPATQVKWGLSYIRVRYGTACNAWAHWRRDRWY